MSEAVICYPRSFLERPEDRLLLMELKNLGVDASTAKLMLYRLWADFATGGSDKRPVASAKADLAGDNAVKLLEGFCEWPGHVGDLVKACLIADFLRYEQDDGKAVLRCNGFFPINSSWCRTGNSMQKKGGWSRAAQKKMVVAEREAEEREKLWKANGFESLPGLTESQRGDALRFILRISKSMNIAVPGDSDLRSGLLRMASDILDNASAERITNVVVWLIGNREAEGIPRRMDQVLRSWTEIEKRAISEMG